MNAKKHTTDGDPADGDPADEPDRKNVADERQPDVPPLPDVQRKEAVPPKPEPKAPTKPKPEVESKPKEKPAETKTTPETKTMAEIMKFDLKIRRPRR